MAQVESETEFAMTATRELILSYDLFDAKERVKQSIDIVDLVGSYIQLRRQGRNYVGLCPWHDDSHPSLQVNPERQSFKCWVCDIGGDIFSFVMKLEGVEFREALEILADRAGIKLERRRAKKSSLPTAGTSENPQPPSPTDEKRTLFHAMAWATKQYHHCLLRNPEAEAARRYLAERGITQESIERFGLGFSPLERDWILRQVSADVSAEKKQRRAKILETIGILARGADGTLYDRFKGRVLFSIRDVQGRPVGIGGRVLPELGQTSPAKYVNSPETPLFTKSKLLYGLDLARDALRKTRTALVMEGYTDVIVAHQYGFQNAVAVLGTALGDSHIKLLKSHADRIILVLDGDEAGTKRANEVLELFIARQVDLRILTLPENLDPCDYLQKYGAEAFADLLEHKAVDALDHAFETHTRGIDLERDIHGISQAVERLLSIVARAPRLSGAASSYLRIQEQKLIQRLAGKFRLDEVDLRRRLAALRRGTVSRISTGTTAAQIPAEEKKSSPDPWELAVLQLIVAHPESFPAIRKSINASLIGDKRCRTVFDMCCRLNDEGKTPSFEQLMLVFDTPEIKSLLVGVDETAQLTGQSSADPEYLLNELVKTQQLKEIERRRPAQIVALREGGLDVDAQKELLLAAIRQQRSRQGISEPTDG